MQITTKKGLVIRPSRQDDLSNIYELLMDEIDRIPYYNDVFKATEKKRISPAFLKHLHSIDPHLIMVGEAEGKIAGFIMACPNSGVILIDWAMSLGEYKKYDVSQEVLRMFINYFDNSQWHKMTALVRVTNRKPAILLAGFKFKKTCVLKEHFFGEDYGLWELPLNKTIEGYELGVRLGRLGRLKQYWSNLKEKIS